MLKSKPSVTLAASARLELCFLLRCHLPSAAARPALSFASWLLLGGFWPLALAIPHIAILPAVSQSYSVSRSFPGHPLILHLITSLTLHPAKLLFCLHVCQMPLLSECLASVCLSSFPPFPPSSVYLSNNRCTVGVY